MVVVVEDFHMGLWTLGLGALGAAITGVIVANFDQLLPKAETATLAYLSEAELRTLDREERTLKAGDLWSKSGAVIMAEAAEISSLRPQLDELGVPLYGVIKENINNELKNFQPFFKGEIFLDAEMRFYGPKPRTMGLMGFMRLGVWKNFVRAWQKGFSGNKDGEGFILGGVFVIGAGQQGVLLEHREKEFGDVVNINSVLEAARKIETQRTEPLAAENVR